MRKRVRTNRSKPASLDEINLDEACFALNEGRTVRPEMVARGKKLLDDPDYPDKVVARALADILWPALQ